MVLYILRHGKAARQDPDKPSSLNSTGQAEVQRVAEHFKEKGLKVEALWHSPKTRARQTAEIFLEVVGKLGVKVEEKKELEPEGEAQDVVKDINGFMGGSLLVVSHLPLVEEVGSLLAGESREAILAFPTGGVVAFEKKGGAWKWLWSLDPHSL
jgi:phosphohistidine phosphatase